MAAAIRAQIDAEMPAEKLRNALDADLDGVEDVGLFAQIASNAETLCRARLGSAAAALPSDPDQAPDIFKEAVLASCLILLGRRANLDKAALAVWLERQAAAFAILDKIAAGERSLFPAPWNGRMVKAEPLEFGRRGQIL